MGNVNVVELLLIGATLWFAFNKEDQVSSRLEVIVTAGVIILIMLLGGFTNNPISFLNISIAGIPMSLVIVVGLLLYLILRGSDSETGVRNSKIFWILIAVILFSSAVMSNNTF